jgi:hypothetical protein
MEESQDIKWSKAGTKSQILHDLFYVIHKTGEFMKAESWMIVTRDWVEGVEVMEGCSSLPAGISFWERVLSTVIIINNNVYFKIAPCSTFIWNPGLRTTISVSVCVAISFQARNVKFLCSQHLWPWTLKCHGLNPTLKISSKEEIWMIWRIPIASLYQEFHRRLHRTKAAALWSVSTEN